MYLLDDWRRVRKSTEEGKLFNYSTVNESKSEMRNEMKIPWIWSMLLWLMVNGVVWLKNSPSAQG